MIKSIHVKNYILIDDINIDFSSGLNVITGETGAGKSILINAIDIVFGAKISSNIIKNGAEKTIIEIVIQSENNSLKNLLINNEIDFSKEIIISREITSNSSRYRVNGSLVNQNFIKDLKKICLDIHSQHQTYSFLQPKTHITLLDNYAKDFYGKELFDYQNLYKKYSHLLQKLNELEQSANYTESQIDFLNFQIKEIEDAVINNTNEDEELQNQLKVLENSEKLKELTYSSYWALNGENENLVDTISQIKWNISKAVKLDNSLEQTESSLIELYELAKDISSSLKSYSQSLSDNDQKLNEIQERLFLLNKLKRKYGNTLQDVLNTYENLSNELNNINFSEQNIDEIKVEIKNVLTELEQKADYISNQRKKYAKQLSNLVIKELEKLELSKAKFEIKIKEEDLTVNGKDNVEFFISTNISQDLAPLAKTASGGELSRVMLAMKTIFADADDIDTVIFDEIDTGISGKAAQSVAEEISKLSKYRQIILITHQAIIASKADEHISVSKEQKDKTIVNIKLLEHNERITELAKLASGEENKASKEFAKSLIENK
ncbi:DNA repair protein RecN [bacterium]|nr:DNA repair protein RecN [bacterium]